METRYNTSLSPIQQLDEVLRFLAISPYAKGIVSDADIHSHINTPSYKITESDLIKVLKKLVKDEYILCEEITGHYLNVRTLLEEPYKKDTYKITWEGNVFITYEGGYTNRILKKEKETRDLLELNHKTQKTQTRMVTLTWILAVSTAIASCYYLLEIWKYYYDNGL